MVLLTSLPSRMPPFSDTVPLRHIGSGASLLVYDSAARDISRRDLSLSFDKMLLVCARMVRSVTASSAAISWLVGACASSSKTSSSRLVRSGTRDSERSHAYEWMAVHSFLFISPVRISLRRRGGVGQALRRMLITRK